MQTFCNSANSSPEAPQWNRVSVCETRTPRRVAIRNVTGPPCHGPLSPEILGPDRTCFVCDPQPRFSPQLVAQWFENERCNQHSGSLRGAEMTRSRALPIMGPPIKKDLLKLRSINNAVIAPARTGKFIASKHTVIKADQTKSLTYSWLIPKNRLLGIVPMAFIQGANTSRTSIIYSM